VWFSNRRAKWRREEKLHSQQRRGDVIEPSSASAGGTQHIDSTGFDIARLASVNCGSSGGGGGGGGQGNNCSMGSGPDGFSPMGHGTNSTSAAAAAAMMYPACSPAAAAAAFAHQPLASMAAAAAVQAATESYSRYNEYVYMFVV